MCEPEAEERQRAIESAAAESCAAPPVLNACVEVGHQRDGEEDRSSDGGRGGGEPRVEEAGGEPVHEPAPEQTVEETRDRGRLAVREGDAVRAHIRIASAQEHRDGVAARKERRPHNRRPDRPRRVRVPRGRGLEQVCVCGRAQAEQPVVVPEVHIPVEGERPQVREVIEAIALKAGAKRQLRRQSDGKQGRKEGLRPRPDHGAGYRGGNRRDDTDGPCGGMPAGELVEDRSSGDLPRQKLEDGCARERDRGQEDRAAEPGRSSVMCHALVFGGRMRIRNRRAAT